MDKLWHIGDGASLLVASAGRLSSHVGGAPVCLVGLYGKFRLRVHEGKWLFCRAAIIPPAVRHELDFLEEPVAALYLEPNRGGLGGLRAFLSGAQEAGDVLVGTSSNIHLLRTLYEDQRQDLDAALADLIEHGTSGVSADAKDPRIDSVLDYLQTGSAKLVPAARVAGTIRLSSSRFQHLFTQHAGVPFRYYRAWIRLRAAMREIAQGSTFTSAAHESGFADSAHFAHDFRRMFGSTASLTLRTGPSTKA